jgi:hypothetical protein
MQSHPDRNPTDPPRFLWRRPSSLITDNGHSDIVQNRFQENAVVHLRRHKCCDMRAGPTVWSALGHLVDLTGPLGTFAKSQNTGCPSHNIVEVILEPS